MGSLTPCIEVAHNATRIHATVTPSPVNPSAHMSTRRFAQRDSLVKSRDEVRNTQQQVPFSCYSNKAGTTPLALDTFSPTKRSEDLSHGQETPNMGARRKINGVSEVDATNVAPRKPGLLELEMIAIDALTHLRSHNKAHIERSHSNSTPLPRQHALWTRTASSSSFATSSSAPDSNPSEYFSSDEDNSLDDSPSNRTPLASSLMLRAHVVPDSGESEVEEDFPIGRPEVGDSADRYQAIEDPTTGSLGLRPNERGSQRLDGSSSTPDLTDESAAASDSDSGSTYSDAKRRASTSRRQNLRPRKRRRAQIHREGSQSSASSSHTLAVARPRFKRRPQAMPEVHNAKARRYACRVPGCTWAFARSPERTRHEATHNEREMWKCGHCGLLLSRKDSALRHHYTQHKDEEVQIARAALS